MIIYKFDKS